MFPGGLIVRHVRGTTFESVDLSGRHMAYVKAEHVEYEPTIVGEILKLRSTKNDASDGEP